MEQRLGGAAGSRAAAGLVVGMFTAIAVGWSVVYMVVGDKSIKRGKLAVLAVSAAAGKPAG